MSIIVQPQFFQVADFKGTHAFANALTRLSAELQGDFLSDVILFKEQSSFQSKLGKLLSGFRDGLNVGLPLQLVRNSLIDNLLFQVADDEVVAIGRSLGFEIGACAALFTVNDGTVSVVAPSLFRIKDGCLSHGALQLLEGQERVAIGRGQDVLFFDTSISRDAAVIRRDDEEFKIEVCPSKSATVLSGGISYKLNSKDVSLLDHGDVVTLGDCQFVFLVPGHPISHSIAHFNSPAKAA